jgi:cytochrome c-type biogenesis protein CcmH
MLAAQDMAEEDRTAMIEGMVSGLAERLATEGGSVSEWARLISAYGVLGRQEDAKAVLTEGRDVFGASQGALQMLNEAAVQAGLEH